MSNSLRKACLCVAGLILSMVAFAQTQVGGTVLDGEGQPLIGAGVVVEGQPQTGTVTDFDGHYTLTVPSDAVALRFSFIGLEDKVVEIAGRTVIDVVMDQTAIALEGVVVTALGIKRAERSVTYNVQKLSDEVFVTREANLVNSLQGKLAGVQITQTAGGVGGETKVVMRGAKSIANSNNALYVLDGIPLPELSLTSPGDSYSIYSGAGLTGDGIANFNSEDIAEMNALVGSSAAALYGYKAGNGILMLTSKTGEKGFHLSYSNNTTFSNPFILPRIQNSYGAKLGQYESWGNKLGYTPSWSFKDFFQTGVNQSHAVSLSLGGENYTSYVSAGYNGATGIIPNNEYTRYNFTFRHNADFLDGKMHLSLLGMYINVAEQNMLAGGLYHNPLVPVYLMSPSDNLFKYAAYERYDADRNFPVQYWTANQLSMQNPFWLVNRNIYQTKKNRFLFGASLSYDIAKWIDIQGRVRTDYNNTVAEQKFYASSNGLFAGEYGRYYFDTYKTHQTYADVLLNIHHDFNQLIQVNAVLGASIEDYNHSGVFIDGDLTGVANLFTLANMETGKGFRRETFLDQTQSVFGTFQLGFKNMVFLDLTAREDWTTAMTKADGTVTPIFYPSIGLSGIFTDILGIKSEVLNFAKGRVSYAEVGNPIARFLFNPTLDVSGGAVARNTWAVADDFSPERTKSLEAGLDLRLFKGKLNLAGTYYNARTYNQVFTPVIAGSSTNSTLYINSGRVDNKGFELTASFKQDIGKVNWQTDLNYSRNINKIVNMLDADYKGASYRSTELSVGGSTGVKMWLTEGGKIGDIYVTGLKTDEHGFIWTSPTGGTVTPALTANGTMPSVPSEMIYAGNINPSWTGSWRNSFSWKGLSLSALVTARVGGIGVSLTEATLDAYGMSQRSADDRDNNGTLVNDNRIGSQAYYNTITGGNGQDALGAYYVYSMTNVRLAELSLGYDVPVNKVLPWVKSMNVSLIGRNLAMLYCKAPFDPELSTTAGNYGAGIDLFMMPSTRNLGFSVKLNF